MKEMQNNRRGFIKNATVHHPQYPAFQDFGDVMVTGDGGTGYLRVDGFTPMD